MSNKKLISKSSTLETLYSNKKQDPIIIGIQLPSQWIYFNKVELEKQARVAISKMSQSTNLELTAQELGFKNIKHFIEICFNYILK